MAQINTVLKLFSKDLTGRKETWDMIFIFKPQLDITINDCLTFGMFKVHKRNLEIEKTKCLEINKTFSGSARHFGTIREALT